MLRRSLCLLLLVAGAACAQQHPIALTGTILTPGEVIPDGTVPSITA